ncbi:D-glucuronyl C5-epimerase [Methanosarcina siciliae T4/M]|uniref:D-glucuronyl C5-epimerase n=2 Tax=Methanosarcina siciliae TaxID=38027 RepID=A0A0E3P5Z8_9EURY|nr:D-glucuronyl C5-epimerase [Methanosarcina siciliae T4/M]
MKYISNKHLIIVLFSLIFTSLVYNVAIESEKQMFRNIYYPIMGNSVSNVVINESGIPMIDYGYSNEIYVGKQINPVLISQQALYYEYEYQRGNESCKKLFLNNANYLVESAVQYNNYTLWQYNFPWPPYNLTSPWVSAMAQGQGVQALIKAYNMTGEDKYLNSARLALNSFYIDVENGGVTYKDRNGWWYEEYVTGTDVQPRVLNGMIFSLFGIYEYYRITGDEDAKFLFDQGIISLKNNLYKYDSGDWTHYDAIGNKAGISYNKVHINQMLQLYEITGDSFFKEYYEKFNKYDQSPISTLKSKKLDYILYISNFIFLSLTLEMISSLKFKKYVRNIYSRQIK